MMRRLGIACLAGWAGACQTLAAGGAGPTEAPVLIRDAGAAAPDAAAGSDARGAQVAADSPFLLVMPARPGVDPSGLALEYRRNAGPWTRVEAHDFPLPERERAVEIAALDPSEILADWRPAGAIQLSVTQTAQGPALQAAAEGAPGYALIDGPWALDAFAFTVAFDPQPGAAFGLVFGFTGPDAHVRAVLDPAAGRMRVEQVDGGRARTLAATPASPAPGAPVTLTVQGEDGVIEVELGDGEAVLSLPRPQGIPAEALGLYLAAGARASVTAFTLEGEAATPPVSQVSRPASLAAPPDRSGVVWPLVIRRFADGALMNEAGDRFAFRMVDGAGRRAHAGADPALTLSVPPGHLGGTFVETPGRIGPFQSEIGALYFIMEPSETDNRFMMVKSDDGGRTWREVDGANRPATGDLEAVDARLAGGTIHIVHQITETVLHHAFDTGTDRWVTTDEVVAEVEAVSQMATLAVRGDGSMAAVFLGDQLYVSAQTPQGDWSAPGVLDREADALTVGPQALAGADGAVHVAYADTRGSIWLRTIQPDGAVGPRAPIAQGAVTGEAEYGAVLPLAFIEAADTLVIAYRLADGTLWERRLTGGRLSAPAKITERSVITNAVDSQQAGADIVSEGEALHALFIEAGSRSIYSVHDCGAGWSQPVLRVAEIEGSWVRGAVYRDPEGGSVYRYVYDAGSNGGSGLNRYGEIALDMCR